MLIGGLQKFSFIDFPKRLAAVVFTQGCSFLCHFCHNPELVLKKSFLKPIEEKDFFIFLNQRVNKLDGVVISGGEPTIHNDLIDFIKKIKKLSFDVKLDTNGTNPSIIKQLLDENLLDYIAMDIKAPLENYKKIINRNCNLNDLKESISLILNSQIDYEFRTTLIKEVHAINDVEKMAMLIQGAKNYFLQKFVPTKTLNPEFKNFSAFSESEMKKIQKISKQYVNNSFIR